MRREPSHATERTEAQDLSRQPVGEAPPREVLLGAVALAEEDEGPHELGVKEDDELPAELVRENALSDAERLAGYGDATAELVGEAGEDVETPSQAEPSWEDSRIASDLRAVGPASIVQLGQGLSELAKDANETATTRGLAPDERNGTDAKGNSTEADDRDHGSRPKKAARPHRIPRHHKEPVDTSEDDAADAEEIAMADRDLARLQVDMHQEGGVQILASRLPGDEVSPGDAVEEAATLDEGEAP